MNARWFILPQSGFVQQKNQVRQQKYAGWDAEKAPRPLFKTLALKGNYARVS